MAMVTLASWGRVKKWEHTIRPVTDKLQAANVITTNKPGLAYGSGRSYGDVCLNPGGILWTTTGLDNFISFNEKNGRLICESGVLLRDIQRLATPRGWMLPVTPGTQIVTVGGAVANDVHGKNHHVMGTFGEHVRKITLLRTNGEIIECGPKLQPEWFAATIGGIGLTGFILSVELQLRPVAGPWIDTEIIPYENLDEFFHLSDTSNTSWEYTVSWIDCLSGNRGIFMRGNHSDKLTQYSYKPRSLNIPFSPPISVFNKLSLRLLNTLYFNIKKRQSDKKVIHYEPFFYQLDYLHNWNRLYGPKGFYQYQCVVPGKDNQAIIQNILHEISQSGTGSFLAVLKTFGDSKSKGMLSFPQNGVTLALDFPNNGKKTLRLFSRLDRIVQEANGRIYLAKDMRMSRSLFESGYPRLAEFLHYRDPGISSAMSRRLMGY